MLGIKLRLALLLVTSGVASSQDPRIAQDVRAQRVYAAPSPEPLETVGESIPYPPPTPLSLHSAHPHHGSQRTAKSGTLKRIFDTVVHGKSEDADREALEERNARDMADSVLRVVDGQEGVLANGDPWVILIHSSGMEEVDKHYIDTHGNASRHLRDIDASTKAEYPPFRFARVDYMREWQICTRWLVFRAPFILIISPSAIPTPDSSESIAPQIEIRFLKHHHVFRGGGALTHLLTSGDWEDVPIWQSSFGPGGGFSPLVELYISAASRVSTVTANIPHVAWLLMALVASRWMLRFMHSPTPGRAAVRAPNDPGAARATGAVRGR